MLRRLQLVCVLSTALAAGSVFSTVAHAQAQPTKVAVVNVFKVFTSVQEYKDIQSKTDSDTRAFKAEVDGHQQELNSLKQQRDSTLKQDTPQYDDMTRQLQQKEIQYQTELKIKQIDQQQASVRQIKAMYEKIQATVSDMAKQRGIDLVITESRPEIPPNFQELTPEQLSNLIKERNIIYAAPSIDLTSDAVTALDAKYKH